MFDCELIAADDDNISYSLGEYIYIKQVTDEMEELGGYSIHSIGLEDGSPIWQGKKEVAPKQFTGSTIKAGIIHYRQGLDDLDEAPIIKYYTIYARDSEEQWHKTPIWIMNE